MNGKKSTIYPALLAILVAAGVIGIGMYAGIPINLTTTSTPASTLGTTSSQVQTQTSTQSVSQSSSQTASSQTTEFATSTSSTTGSGGEGSLSILLTDPPNIPQGVTKIYVSYSDLQVHVAKAGNSSGWTTVQSSGEIELLGTLNFSQTLSSVKIATGVYNQLRFNISSAEITYDSQNYTAFVQSAELIVPIVHGVPVNATGPTAVIIDISPTVVNIGSHSTPEFIIRSVAVAYPISSSDVSTQMQQTGGRVSLANATWWLTIVRNSNSSLQIGSAALSSTSLNLSVSNTGNTSTQIGLIVISPLLTSNSTKYLPTSILGTAVFSILPNGTLVPLFDATPVAASAGANAQASVSPAVFRMAGYNLTAGSSVRLSYSGPIHLGFLTAAAVEGAIKPGQSYLITVIGTQTSVSTTVVAT